MKKITIVVADNKVGTILSCISGEFVELHVTDHVVPGQPARPPTITRKRASSEGGLPAVVLNYVRSHKPVSQSEVNDHLVGLGFSKNSTAARLSELCRAGTLVRLPSGEYTSA